MSFDPYSTYWLQQSVEMLPPIHTFLKNRYFPDGDTFTTNKIMIEKRNGTRKAAPFITKRSAGIELERDGSTLEEFTPALIAPKRTLTLDQLEHRGFGEQLNSNMEAAERALYYNTRDLNDLRPTISITKEAMASQVIFENKLTLTEYTDKLENGRKREIKFYSGDTNNAVYTPAKNWDYTEDSGRQIIADIKAMIKMQSEKGLPATELLCSTEAADVIMNNVYIQKLLDNRRIEIGRIAPAELIDGAVEFAVLNIGGRMISFISYDNTYTGLDGKLYPFIPSGYVALAAPAKGVAGTNIIGQTVYGAITQMEDDKEFHTYAGMEVPKFRADVDHNERSLTLSSAPLVMPIADGPFISAKVIGA